MLNEVSVQSMYIVPWWHKLIIPPALRSCHPPNKKNIIYQQVTFLSV